MPWSWRPSCWRPLAKSYRLDCVDLQCRWVNINRGFVQLQSRHWTAADSLTLYHVLAAGLVWVRAQTSFLIVPPYLSGVGALFVPEEHWENDTKHFHVWVGVDLNHVLRVDSSIFTTANVEHTIFFWELLVEGWIFRISGLCKHSLVAWNDTLKTVF